MIFLGIIIGYVVGVITGRIVSDSKLKSNKDFELIKKLAENEGEQVNNTEESVV